MHLDLMGSRLVARVVYDGSATTGKTTNVRRLASLLRGAAAPEGAPAIELAGRTLYFDWLTVRAGAVAGVPLVCDVLTVPGQPELRARRERTLADADVVVHVCDARESALTETREALAWLREHLAARAAPPLLVIQANKQDHPGALRAAALASALADLVEDAQVIDAIARDGIGVVDTFVTAVHALEAAIVARDRPIPIGSALDREALHDALDALPIDRAWLAELALAEAVRVASEPASIGPVEASSTAFAPPPWPSAAAPAGAVWPALSGRLLLAELSRNEAFDVPLAPFSSGETTRSVAAWELHTSLDQRFDDEAAARDALLAAARAHARVARSTEGDAVLVLARASDGAHWLWTIRPVGDARWRAA